MNAKKFQQIVYRKKGSKAIDTLWRYLVDFFTLRTSNILLLLRLFRHDLKTPFTVGVKAWKNFRLVVPGKANGTGQFLVHTFSQGLALGALTDSPFLGHLSRKGRGKSHLTQ